MLEVMDYRNLVQRLSFCLFPGHYRGNSNFSLAYKYDRFIIDIYKVCDYVVPWLVVTPMQEPTRFL